MGNRPLVIAHRALTLGGIENSLAGIRCAAAAGADLVELDVRRSVDGMPFLIHDPVLGRTTHGHGPVCLTPAALLRRLRLRGSDERVPSLAQALATLPSDVHPALHVKAPGALRAVLALVRSIGVEDRTWLWLEGPAAVRTARAVVPAARCTLLKPGARFPDAAGAYLADAAAVSAHAISVPWATVFTDFMERAHRQGLMVFAVHRPGRELAPALAAGIDGLITDDPAAVRAVIDGAVPDGAARG